MSFQAPIAIIDAVENIDKKRYFLPSIQRGVVWSSEQIEYLFDSLMRGYPIGSFLFWQVNKKSVSKFKFYDFLRDFHERDTIDNPEASVSRTEDITGVLDGQQRLTALYIGLYGKYSYKIPWKRWDNDAAFPERELYLNLLRKPTGDSKEFDFQFLTKEESLDKSNTCFWFKLKDIRSLNSIASINIYLKHNKLDIIASPQLKPDEVLFGLFEVIYVHNLINFYLEKSQELDKVLNIFIRVNSYGTPLSYSDLLLSIASASWKNKDARREIHNLVSEINGIGDKFIFVKDNILKTSLVLSDIKNVAFKVDNFNNENMQLIENNWDNISNSIKLAVKLISNFGFNRDTLTANNALIPVAYYLLKLGNPANYVESLKNIDDKKNISKWLRISLLKRVFSGNIDNTLSSIREIILKNHLSFPLQDIIDTFRGTNRTLLFTDDDIENLFSYQWGHSYTFSALSLIYPSLDFRNKFHQDHIFPKSLFSHSKLSKRGYNQNKIDLYFENYNYFANLQLLEGIPNQEKQDTDFIVWINKIFPEKTDRENYMKRNYIPDIDLSFDNFEEFISERKKLITVEIRKLLTV